jgi:hypothetical protein
MSRAFTGATNVAVPAIDPKVRSDGLNPADGKNQEMMNGRTAARRPDQPRIS